MRLLHGLFGLRGSISFDVDERSDECDLKIDLHAAQRGRAGQDRDLIERALELLYGLLQRPPSRFVPQGSVVGEKMRVLRSLER